MGSSGSSRAAVGLQSLTSFLNDYLEIDGVEDYCPNGLQVEGPSEVSRVVTGVSACAELFRLARAQESDAVVVHHGLFWKGAPRTLTGVQFGRVASLIEGGMSLLAYHLPLDRHPTVGNNAVAMSRLGLENAQPFGSMGNLEIGFAGSFRDPAPRDSVLESVEALYGQEPLAFLFGPDVISRVAVVSGAGSRALEEAVAKQIDLFVTGEAEEWTMNLAREHGINVLAAGHYATERLGVQALAALLESDLGIQAQFIDVPNPV